MNRNLSAVRVSPTIKAARYAFLISGIIYGVFKLKALRLYDSKERVIRRNRLEAQHKRELMELKKKNTAEVIDVAKEFGVTDFPPGWNDDL